MASYEFNHEEANYTFTMSPCATDIEFTMDIKTERKGWRGQLFKPRQSLRSREDYQPPQVHVSLMTEDLTYLGLPDPLETDPPGST